MSQADGVGADVASAWAVLESAVENGEVPGAVAVIGRRDTLPEHLPAYDVTYACGVTHYGDARGDVCGGAPVTPDTRYDLASLTKVMATLPSILTLLEGGEVSLHDPLKRFFSNAGWMQTPSSGDLTLRQLLTHSSGLPAWTPLFAQVSTRLTALANVLQTPLARPVGEVRYSDLNFILLGAVVERVSGLRLDAFAAEHVFGPLSMTHTAYGVPDGAPVAATEDCGWRGRLLQGEVHDENAFVMDGVAGHAGLFGTAGDVARYARAWLELGAPFASPELLRLACSEQVRGEAAGRRGLGWQLYGGRADASAYGHTGFTGTSLYIDPEGGWFAVLLTNRVHPSRACGETIQQLRASFHSVLAESLRCG